MLFIYCAFFTLCFDKWLASIITEKNKTCLKQTIKNDILIFYTDTNAQAHRIKEREKERFCVTFRGGWLEDG